MRFCELNTDVGTIGIEVDEGGTAWWYRMGEAGKRERTASFESFADACHAAAVLRCSWLEVLHFDTGGKRLDERQLEDPHARRT